MPRRTVENLADVKADQIVLVGRLSINQKLPESTNVVDTIGITEGGVVRVSEGPLPFTEPRPDKFEKHDMLVPWGKSFGVAYERRPQLWVSGIYAFTFNKFGQQTYAFPVTGIIKTGGGGKYFYVGHIKLKLEDFFVLKDVQVVDEFATDKGLARYPGIKKSLFKPNN